jgi:hypothetical protein
MVRDQPKARRRLGTSGLVDAARHRGRVGHARSGTEERRAYSGFFGDRYGARLVMWLTVMGWSVASLASGAVMRSGG